MLLNQPPTFEWNCQLNQLTNEDDHELPIGELRLSLKCQGFKPKPCLFILAVDQSGSMSGRPFAQCKDALTHIIKQTNNNPNIKTVLIAYESVANIINLNEDAEQKIKNLNAGGGTNFMSCFEKIKEVIGKYVCDDSVADNNVSSCSIAFMTDGEDGSGYPINDMPNKLKDMITSCWNAPFIVHSVGFGSNHNFNFLENLRKIGTTEGLYRFADYSDEGDALCNKLVGIFNMVSSSSSIPINIKMDSNYPFYSRESINTTMSILFPVDNNGRGVYTSWIRLLQKDHNELYCSINSELGNITQNVPIAFNTTTIETRKPLLKKWLNNSIDEIAAELLELNKKEKNIVFELHCAFLTQRIQSIVKSLSDTNAKNKLETLSQQLELLKKGNAINQMRLNDLKFDNKVAQSNIKVQSTYNNKNNQSNQNIQVEQNEQYYVVFRHREDGKITFMKGGNRRWNRIFETIVHGPRSDVIDLEFVSMYDMQTVDRDGNTPLHWASYIGHRNAIKYILAKDGNKELLNKQNYYGHNCLELAINNNRWKSAEILIQNGATVKNGDELLKYTLEHKYLESASVLLAHGFATLNDEMNSYLPPETIEWIMKSKFENDTSNMNLDNYLKLAVSKGMVDLFQNLVDRGGKLTEEMLLSICTQTSNNYLTIIEKILQQIHPDCKMTVGETPLFLAAQKGCLENVKLLLKYKATIDIPNASGNTPLWIACCNGHTEIVAELLNADANPNIANEKGNTPLIPACQRGCDEIVMMLLAKGAVAEVINANGDSSILICCRTGQASCLELLLQNADPQAIYHKAHIDGFDALFAAVESDKDKCVKIILDKCNKKNIENKTDPDNPIIAGATALHLAAFYNRPAAMRMLLENGANPNSIDINGQTPLHTAVIQGHAKMVQLLRNFNADLNIRDNNGFTPAFYCRNNHEIKNELTNPAYNVLMKIARKEYPETEEKNIVNTLVNYSGIIGFLTQCDAVDVVSSEGRTPLLESIIYSNHTIVQTLLMIGANPYYTDSKGLNAFVWANWINEKNVKSLLPISSHVHNVNDAINNLQSMAKQDVRNSMVLYLSKPPTNKNFEINFDSNICDKMNKYIEKTSCDKMLEIKNNNTSIIAFFDKLNDPRIDKNSYAILQHLLWYGKVFVTSVVASGEKDLQPQHILALYMYTTNTIISDLVNDALITMDTKYMLPYIQIFNDALLKLPNFEGTVFRGVTAKFDRILYAKGKEIQWPIYNTGSLQWKIAGEFAKSGTMFLIKTKTAKIIRQYSQHPQNSEVILMPNTKYRVTNYYKYDVVCLGQENIREKTFGIKDVDLEKYINSSDSVIIELTEL